MRAAPTMAMESPKKFVASLAAAVPLVAAKAAVATEGTGEPWGIDDGRLTFVLGAGFTFIFLLFSAWNAQQDDDEDFFDYYDKRRN